MPTHSELDAYGKDISRYRVLTRAEERALARRSRRGNRAAKNRLIASNLRLVLKLAFEYRGYGLPLLDLVQEGNLGLLRAVEKFDPDRGVRLISYAAWWIRAFMKSYVLRNWSLVRIGTTQAQRKLFFTLSRAQRALGNELQEESAQRHAVLAGALKVRPSDVAEMEIRRDGRDVPLDAPRAEGSRSSLTEILAVSPSPSPEELFAEAEERHARRVRLAHALRTLNRRERLIVRRRLLNEEPETLLQLGGQLGVSRERVRQVEQQIYGKLRAAMA